MKLFSLILCSLALTVQVSAQKTAKPAAKPVAKAVNKPAATTAAASTKTFPNGITMNIKGFKVSEAALYYEDGSKVAEDNTIELNQKVIMYAVIDGGYKVVGGKVFPGSSERIVLSNGYEVLKTGDLFADYNTGVKAEDGKYISLKAMMTQIDDKSMEITVSFKIWDKKSTSNITGSYKLHIK
ncbi:MAG: hypothetical protein U0V75_17690 [Ferruginibacter sp.]